MRRLAYWLRRFADRIDHRGAPKAIGWSFVFVQGEGIRFIEGRAGCPLWYLGDDDYERAHTWTPEKQATLDLMDEKLRALGSIGIKLRAGNGGPAS